MRLGTFSLLASCSALTLHAHAAPMDFTDRAFVEAMVIVMSFDLLAERCRAQGGFSAADAAKVEEWQERNRVAAIRGRIDALSSDPRARESLADLRKSMDQKFAPIRDAQNCAAAVATAALDDAQFASRSPSMVEALSAAAPGAAPGSPATSQSPLNTKAPQSSANLAARIVGFAFDSSMRMGVGGYIYMVPTPVVLFRNGDALTDVEGLSFRAGLDAHKRAHPDAWSRWRRSGGRLQLHSAKEGWRNLAYNTSYAKLPRGFALDGVYQSLSGSGSVAVGGTDSVAAWSDYAFARNGRVVRGGGAGAYAEASGGSTAVSSAGPDRRGRYRIDGVTLHIEYDDGSSEARIIVTDPKDPGSAIWLDGVGYTREDK